MTIVDIQKTVENLSSRRLWAIINTTEQAREQGLIAAARVELMKREEYSENRAFHAPH